MDRASVWSVLENVHDPEIPVISVVELGVIQDVEVRPDRVRVGLTPTFAGCPALAPIHAGNFELMLLEPATCPYCSSQDTVLKNGLGPTACRTIHFCNNCRQSVEVLKPI